MLLLPLRRSHLRYPPNKVISYSHRDKRLLTVTLNLGLGGMKIKTPYHLSPGELLDFILVLGDVSIGLKGRTVYSHALPNKQKVSGIEFIDLSEQDWRMLRDYLIALERWPKKRGMRYATKRRATREKKEVNSGKQKISYIWSRLKRKLSKNLIILSQYCAAPSSTKARNEGRNWK